MKDVDAIARGLLEESIGRRDFREPRTDEVERAVAGMGRTDESASLRSERLYRRSGRVMGAAMAACLACMVAIGEFKGESLGSIVAKSLPDDFARRFEASVRSLSRFMYPPPGGKG